MMVGTLANTFIHLLHEYTVTVATAILFVAHK
jgi:hypothetical protein